MPKPSDRTRAIHSEVRRAGTGASENISSQGWSRVLRDSGWWCIDPARCSSCFSPAIYKTSSGAGFCHDHFIRALEAAAREADELIGRYDRAKSYLNFGVSRMAAALPKRALDESVALDGIETLQLHAPDSDIALEVA
jgi:hypothetical protein